jgi:hypothetical protein
MGRFQHSYWFFWAPEKKAETYKAAIRFILRMGHVPFWSDLHEST